MVGGPPTVHRACTKLHLFQRAFVFQVKLFLFTKEKSPISPPIFAVLSATKQSASRENFFFLLSFKIAGTVHIPRSLLHGARKLLQEFFGDANFSHFPNVTQPPVQGHAVHLLPFKNLIFLQYNHQYIYHLLRPRYDQAQSLAQHLIDLRCTSRKGFNHINSRIWSAAYFASSFFQGEVFVLNAENGFLGLMYYIYSNLDGCLASYVDHACINNFSLIGPRCTSRNGFNHINLFYSELHTHYATIMGVCDCFIHCVAMQHVDRACGRRCG